MTAVFTMKSGSFKVVLVAKDGYHAATVFDGRRKVWSGAVVAPVWIVRTFGFDSDEVRKDAAKAAVHEAAAQTQARAVAK